MCESEITAKRKKRLSCDISGERIGDALAKRPGPRITNLHDSNQVYS